MDQMEKKFENFKLEVRAKVWISACLDLEVKEALEFSRPSKTIQGVPTSSSQDSKAQFR